MTNTADLHNIDIERDWLDGLKALEEQFDAAPKALALCIRVGKGLLAGRIKCPADQDFNDWLDETGYKPVPRNERQDSMWLAINQAIALPILSQTRINNSEWARRYIREALPTIYAQCSGIRPVTETSVTDPQVHQTAETKQNPPALPKSQHQPNENKPSERLKQVYNVPMRGRLHGWPRAEEVFGIYHDVKTRSLLGHIAEVQGGNQIWKLLLTAIDAGFFQQYTITAKRLTARLLFPHGNVRTAKFLSQYDLTKPASRNLVATDLLPRMIANKDFLLANPDDLEQTLCRLQRQQQSEQKATLIAERATQTIAAMPPHESEVIMFGKRLWPIVEGETFGTYDFLTLQTAVWKFTDLNRWLHRDSPVSRAIMIRNSTKWDRHLIGELVKGTDAAIKIERIYSLVHTICSLMEQNPDGECKEPLTPLVLG